jgi:hypothetical protein
MTYCNAVTTRAIGACCGVDSHQSLRCDVGAKVGHRQTPYKAKPPSGNGRGFLLFNVRISQPTCTK